MARITYYISVFRSKDRGPDAEWEFAPTQPSQVHPWEWEQIKEGIYTKLDMATREWLVKPTPRMDWALIEVTYDNKTGECY